MGSHHAEELCHHRGDTGEVMRPGLAFPPARKSWNCHGRLEALGIHGLGCRFEADIYPLPQAEGPIPCNRARISREIFSRAELRRVHEDTDDECITSQSCGSNEGAMAVMQRTHRGDESNGHAFTAESIAPGSHGSRGTDNLHESGCVLQAGRDP